MSYRDELIQVAAVALAAAQVDDTGTTLGMMGMRKVIREALGERKRQNELWGAQTHNRCVWMTILGEEFGEACKAVLEERDV